MSLIGKIVVACGIIGIISGIGTAVLGSVTAGIAIAAYAAGNVAAQFTIAALEQEV